MSDELAPVYEPAEIEARWYPHWESGGAFAAHAGSDRPPYCIVLPPPNVTGALHIGHAFQQMMQDVLVRRARMKGFETLWLPGTDHAGIATQAVVERELMKEGKTRQDLGRDAFVERVWEWKHQYGGRITEQMRRLGFSCDWTRERFTMDEGLSRAVRTIFVRWFDDGLIYRGLRIINWCPRCTTALSDAEVEHKDVAGEIVTFRYPLADGDGHIAVATTRVETMLGDSGIAVHPEDERYRDLIGRRVSHPFFPERDVRVVADDAVDPEFGTGAVKVTPAHDPTDFEIGERHGLEKINIFDKHAHTTDAVGEFAGLDRYAARGAVLARLEELELVDRVERPYVHSVGHCYRCGTELEPWLSEQWFVDMKPLARPAIEAVRDGRIRFVPERFAKQYTDWLENIRDWCISRQLWWGHRIPVWYCDDCGEVWAALDDPASCRGCGGSAFHQDPDVLDTWFSSQLWPFSTLGWPDETPELDFFYPTAVLVTGYEILYLWVARMIFSGLYAMGDVPFREVFLNGIVRDFEGKKMSKSLGNVIDPLDMIDRYGADALRFSLAFPAVPGNDTNASEERIEAARNFANKLWNAARFIFLRAGDDRPPLEGSDALEDRWILSRLDAVTAEVEAALEAYNVSQATHALYAFIWSEFCDWYIELAKLRGDTASTGVLLHVLDRVLRLLHPMMPFVTEELWSHLHDGRGSIQEADWPEPDGRRDEAAEAAIARVQDVVRTARRIKDDHGVAKGRRVPARAAAPQHRGELETMRDPIVALARLASLEVVDDLGSGGGARSLTEGGIELELELGIDPSVERARIQRQIEDAEREIARAEAKLANDSFVSKAPDAVVAKERAKLEEHRSARTTLARRLAELA